ncbi:Uma2 family endonuclease [Desulfallas thermosapovorans]|uniref:Uma2 family endonuclease n=1 Tax=Desulfallas thermosapovorans DSM 6562 TaxID=1121431 RepID=A0A5S4ZNH3_9FIRM|nr:Uma2 family endonuclease [Desulfallas thermosapovorans]TYO93273.1 Uma2 family endonuclease [Desulfallas thermosapovorans DSM 6562]
MSVILSDRVYTVWDYMQLDDGNRYELIGGKLVMVPRPRPKHQRVSGKIFYQIEDFLKKNFLGVVIQEVDVILGSDVVAPDLLFIAKDRLDLVGELNIQGAPDLVIEILSPSSASIDRRKKRKLYLASGVKEYWMVDPDQELVEVLVAEEKEWRWAGIFDREDILTTALLPGLEIRLSEVFKGFNVR